MTEKVPTSIYLDYHTRERLRRISNILNKTETSLVEDALIYYFQNSKVCSAAQKKIIENGKLLQRDIVFFNSRGYEYRKGEDDN